jgi:hypothetical protein
MGKKLALMENLGAVGWRRNKKHVTLVLPASLA